ncbi:hypothetical protein LRAMOSA09797 [Lichtheimia ramosa]|uniref:Uncharacterized protein n=1 Tax=Lichtheimia ramosa TaxID=688394 RepID=A0A077WLX2_9FUNG|nr:hypothetical protein LRAMOSA09797 [Lichtheimia ramosa]
MASCLCTKYCHWPKHSGFYAKVPSLLYYRGRSNRLVDWGEGARRLSLQPKVDGNLVRRFKLCLASDYGAQKESDTPFLLPDQSPVDAIADYLGEFHEHVCEEMEKTGANRYSREQYRYCLTVPAIWDDQAKALMREAMIQAEIIQESDPSERLVMVTEPEAAAIYCEKQSRDWNVQDQENFMIVDAGGGTVDLIIYHMHWPEGGEKLLEEITSASGGSCGSSFIDSNMRALLMDKLGLPADIASSCVVENMMDTFTEKIKPYFCGSEDQYLSVPVSLLSYCQGASSSLIEENGCIRLQAEELNDKVYNPVFQQVVDLIENQLDLAGTDVNAMFLVGGFGCSDYLYNIVEKHFHSRIPIIAMAPRGDIAVARGAVYHVTKPKFVSSKILRHTYGLRTRMAFEEGLDPEDTSIVTSDGIKRCSTRFDVIVRKGQQVKADTKISRRFWATYPHNTDADLYVYDGDNSIPRHTTDPGVRKLAKFPIKMPHLEGFTNGDRVDIRIDFIFGLTELKAHVFIADKQFEFVCSLYKP